MVPLRVGYSRIKLDFPLGIEMAGYAARKGKSIGWLDPLEGFSILLNDSVVIIVFDLLGIPEDFPSRISDLRVIPVATHTHSAPKPSKVLDILIEASEVLIRDSWKNAQEVSELILREYSSEGICDLRNSDESTTLRVAEMDFREFSLVVFPCHPTVLGPENLLYSADLHGAIRRKLKEEWKKEVVMVNSCCGDVSTHRTRRERTPKELKRLSEEFVRGLRPTGEKRISLNALKFLERSLRLEVVEKEIREEELDERSKDAVPLVMRRKKDKRNLRMCALKLGDLNVMFFPFELFYGTCETLPYEVVCYSCGYGSYLVPEGTTGYEWLASPYGYDALDEVLKVADEMIRELRG